MKRLRNDKCQRVINGKIHISCLAPSLPHPQEPSASVDSLHFCRKQKSYCSVCQVASFHFSQCCDKTSSKSHLRKEELILAHSSRVLPIMLSRSSTRSLRLFWSCSIVRKKGEMDGRARSAFFLLLIQSETPSHGQCCPPIGLVFLPQLNQARNSLSDMSTDLSPRLFQVLSNYN